MKRHTRSMPITLTLACLPIAVLSPVILAAVPCVQVAKIDVCGYSGGCKLNISSCSAYNNDPNCEEDALQRVLQTNTFTCVTLNGVGSQCNPVTNPDGSAKSVNCTRMWDCTYIMDSGICQVNVELDPCLAPYYSTDACP